MDLASLVADCLKRHGFEGSAGVVAVSGGPDSVALAHLLVTLLQEGKLARLVFAHLNHQLRGDESDADEAFVRDLPALFQIDHEPRVSVRTERIDVAALACAEHANLESVARRERYRWLAEVARIESADWIATGHSADDQAETVLFHLLRGSGLLGLGAMRECRALDGLRLVRPLLPVRRHRIRAFLEEHRIHFRADSSNDDLRFARNRIRKTLMPLLETEFNPAVADVLCTLSHQAQAAYEEVSARAEQLLAQSELPRADRILVFSLGPLRDASADLVREMFRLVWSREGWPMADMDFASWQRFVALITGKIAAWDLPGNIHARRKGNVIQLNRR